MLFVCLASGNHDKIFLFSCISGGVLLNAQINRPIKGVFPFKYF